MSMVQLLEGLKQTATGTEVQQEKSLIGWKLTALAVWAFVVYQFSRKNK